MDSFSFAVARYFVFGITPGIYLFASGTIVTVAMHMYNRATEQHNAPEAPGDTDLQPDAESEGYTGSDTDALLVRGTNLKPNAESDD